MNIVLLGESLTHATAIQDMLDDNSRLGLKTLPAISFYEAVFLPRNLKLQTEAQVLPKSSICCTFLGIR